MIFVVTCWDNDIATYIPQVSSPLRTSGEVVGSKEIATSSAVIVPWAKRPPPKKVPKIINLSPG